MKLIITILIVAFVQISFCQRNHRRLPKLQVTILYEALCPDSVDLFQNHLIPAFNEHSRHLYLNLVPYGKVSATPVLDAYGCVTEMKYDCQHGPKECYLNRLHLCILNNSPFKRAFKTISCLMSSLTSDPKFCIEDNQLNYQRMEQCANSTMSDFYFQDAGAVTSQYNLKFVPMIISENVCDIERSQVPWRTDFKKTFCSQYTKQFNFNICRGESEDLREEEEEADYVDCLYSRYYSGGFGYGYGY